MMIELRLDVDGPLPDDLEYRVGVLTRQQGWRVRDIRYRRTRHGWHVVIRCPRVVADPWVIVAAQAILGSDWKRENYNLFRAGIIRTLPLSSAWRDDRRWNALYSSHYRLSEET